MFVSRLFQSFRETPKKTISLTDLPQEVLIYIIIHLSSNQVAACRLVCRKFNKLCKKVLNRRFSYYCATVPKLLRDLLKNNSTFASEKIKEGDLQLLSASLLLLRAVFGRYISTGCCCFYPGLILDYVESITVRATCKRKTLMQDSDATRKVVLNRNIRTLTNLVETASNHFESFIEPFLPPPRTFVGTKILDLFASKSEIQAEPTLGLFFQKITEKFPDVEITGISMNRWLKQARKDLMRHNWQWIFKTTFKQISELDNMTKSQIILPWNELDTNIFKDKSTKETNNNILVENSPASSPQVRKNITMNDIFHTPPPNITPSLNPMIDSNFNNPTTSHSFQSYWNPSVINVRPDEKEKTAVSLNLINRTEKQREKSELNNTSQKNLETVKHIRALCNQSQSTQFDHKQKNYFTNPPDVKTFDQPVSRIGRLLAKVEETYLQNAPQTSREKKPRECHDHPSSSSPSSEAPLQYRASASRGQSQTNLLTNLNELALGSLGIVNESKMNLNQENRNYAEVTGPAAFGLEKNTQPDGNHNSRQLRSRCRYKYQNKSYELYPSYNDRF